MISLVLTLPLYSAVVFAEITNVNVYGNDNYPGAVRSSDVIHADANLDMEITPNELVIDLGNFGVHPFTSCLGLNCFFSLPAGDRIPQEIDYTVRQVLNQQYVDAYNGILVVDGYDPEVEEYTLEKESYDLTLDFEVTDTACPTCQSCAGIKEVIITQDGVEREVLTGNNGCSFSDTVETDIDQLNLAPGESELCIQAVDNLNQASDEACAYLFVDREGPYFDGESLRIVRANTEDEVHYTTGNPLPIQLSILVHDDDLDVTTVKANLMGLNTLAADGYAELPGSCVEQEEGYLCVWSSILIDGATGVVPLVFTASDGSANEAVYTASYELIEDTQPPQVIDVVAIAEETSFDFYTEQLYLKQGLNTLAVLLDATGSAFENGNAYLSVGPVTHQQADECIQNGSQWSCLFNVTLPANSMNTQIQVHTDTKDDAGNGLESMYTKQVVIDTQAPVFGTIDASHPCPTSDDVLLLEIEATENTESLGISVTPQNILGIQEQFSSLCVAIDENTFICELELSNFVPYPESEVLDLTLIDAAGNTAVKPYSLQVCESADLSDIDFLQVHPGELDAVDKRTLTLIDYPVFVPLNIQARTSGVTILEQQVTCDGASSAYFVGEGFDADMMMKVQAPPTPDSVFDEQEEDLTVSCTMRFTMKRGLKVFTSPEVEEIEINVPMYGTPLGSVDEVVEQKIEGLTVEIDDAEDEIDKLVQFNTFMGWMCRIAKALGAVNAVIGAIKVVVWAVGIVGDGLQSAAYTKAAGDLIKVGWTAYCTGANVFAKIITNAIWPPGFGIGSTNVPIIKWACIIFSGKLCDGYDGFTAGLGAIPRADRYGYDGETGVLNDFDEFQPLWDPFRSIHTARGCLFLSAGIYNLRKKRQVLCMERTCIRENAENGLPLQICEVMKAQRNCLYVEGAQWKALTGRSGGGEALASFLLTNFIMKLEWWIPSVAYAAMQCPQIINEMGGEKSTDYCPQEQGSIKDKEVIEGIVCHVLNAGLTIGETSMIETFRSFADGSETFKAELPGVDHCLME